MSKYKIIISSRAEINLVSHVSFLANASIGAAKKMRDEFKNVIEEMKENPLLYPKEQNIPLPSDDYRSALFYGRYKIIYKVEKEIIYIDAIFDCRQDNRL